MGKILNNLNAKNVINVKRGNLKGSHQSINQNKIILLSKKIVSIKNFYRLFLRRILTRKRKLNFIRIIFQMVKKYIVKVLNRSILLMIILKK